MLKLLTATGIAVVALTGGAFAADLSLPAASAPPEVVPTAAPGNWDGLYLGANVGYGWGTATSDEFGSTATEIDPEGWTAGGQIGYNFHLSDSLVLGVEGDAEWTNQTDTVHFPDGNYDGTVDANWKGAVTAHLGIDAGSFMPYVLAGVAFENATLSYWDDDNFASNGSNSQTHTGWTVGAGVATAIAPNVSLFGEVRYSDYGSQTYNIDNESVDLTDTSVRVGINYHF